MAQSEYGCNVTVGTDLEDNFYRQALECPKCCSGRRKRLEERIPSACMLRWIDPCNGKIVIFAVISYGLLNVLAVVL
jgi:hypothetical protein